MTSLKVEVNKSKKGKKLGMEVRTTKSKGTIILKVKKDKIGDQLGLVAGDRIVEFDGERIAGWSHVRVNDFMRKTQVFVMTVERDADGLSGMLHHDEGIGHGQGVDDEDDS